MESVRVGRINEGKNHETCLLLACRLAFLSHLACLWVVWFRDLLIHLRAVLVLCSERLEESCVMRSCFVPDLFKAGAQPSDSSRESTKPCLVVCTHAWMICPKQPGWWGGRDTPALSTPSSSLLRPTENPSCIIAKTVRHHRSEVASVSEHWVLNLNTYEKKHGIWSRCRDLCHFLFFDSRQVLLRIALNVWNVLIAIRKCDYCICKKQCTVIQCGKWRKNKIIKKKN